MDVLELSSLFVILETNMGGSTLGKGPIEVSFHVSCAGWPRQFLLVGENSSHESRSVVATETNHHEAELGDSSLCLNNMFFDHVLELFVTFREDSEAF